MDLRINTNYLKGIHKDKSFHWVAWNKITWPKKLGGWGVKHPHCFAKALVARGTWRILKDKGLWVNVVYY